MSEKDTTPEIDPKDTTPKNPEADPKPTEKADEDKTAEELEAEAKAIEDEIKAKKGEGKEEEIKQNQLRRLQKAREKRALLNGDPESDSPKGEKKEGEIAVDDLVTLRMNGIKKDSEQAKILKRYLDGGIISNYEEGLEHVAVKAELEVLNAKNNAKTVVDENDTEDNQLKTKKEMIASYRASGETPQDPEMQKAIAQDNLSKMSL